MAEKDTSAPTPPTPPVAPAVPFSMEQFAETLAGAMAKANAATLPPRKITAGEYARREVKNRGGRKLRAGLTVFQCGFMVTERQMSNTVIELVNGITHSGRYVDRLVEVVLRDELGEDVVDVRWPCKTPDQRNDLAKRVSGPHKEIFENILQMIVDAQKAEREDHADRDKKNDARRAFGSGRSTREAYERSGQ
jgi:hypothetical protein